MKTKLSAKSSKHVSVLCSLLVSVLLLISTTTNAQWIQQGVDIDGESQGDMSGGSVSLSADGFTLAIGGVGNNGDGIDAGHVRVYSLISGTWIQQGEDINGEASWNEFGSSISLSAVGSIVAIGAARNSENGLYSGHVRVYELISGIWTQLGTDIDGEASGDMSGGAVSLCADGSTVAIGAEWNDGNGSNAGHVRVYELISGIWTQQGTDIDGEADGDRSGLSVSLSSDGSIVAIGALNDGNGWDAGHVRVYELISGIWTQQGADIDGEAVADEFGRSVSLSADGSTVAVGAPYNDGDSVWVGHVQVYKLISGTWTQQGADIDGEAENDNFGSSVSLSSDGSMMAIGTPYNDGNGVSAGHVRVYELISGIWIQQGADIDGESMDDYSGSSVSLSSDGSMVAIGAPENNGNGYDSGHVRVYSMTDVSINENDFGNDLIVYPNPTLGDFSVKLDKVYDKLTVSITDINGKLIQTNAYSNTDLIQIELNEPAGVYLLRVVSEDKKAVIELIKE